MCICFIYTCYLPMKLWTGFEMQLKEEAWMLCAYGLFIPLFIATYLYHILPPT